MAKKSMNLHVENWAREYWEQAMASREGLEVEFLTKKEAEIFRFGLYRARNVDRTLNKEIYPEGDPLHGRSVWDALVLKIIPNSRGTTSVMILPVSLAAPRPKSITLLGGPDVEA